MYRRASPTFSVPAGREPMNSESIRRCAATGSHVAGAASTDIESAPTDAALCIRFTEDERGTLMRVCLPILAETAPHGVGSMLPRQKRVAVTLQHVAPDRER